MISKVIVVIVEGLLAFLDAYCVPWSRSRFLMPTVYHGVGPGDNSGTKHGRPHPPGACSVSAQGYLMQIRKCR